MGGAGPDYSYNFSMSVKLENCVTGQQGVQKMSTHPTKFDLERQVSCQQRDQNVPAPPVRDLQYV